MTDSQVILNFVKETDPGAYSVVALSGGRNNNGFKVLSSNNTYFVKSFAPDLEASAAKLKNEFVFSEHLSRHGIGSIATPIAYSENRLLALYSFIEGRPVSRADEYSVDSAISFFQSINATKELAGAENISMATESPKNIRGFYKLVSKRLDIFKMLEPSSSENAECLDFINCIYSDLEKINCEINSEDWLFSLNASILSPSDFGFHNVIMQDNNLFFIDFEYAGFDTPWKFILDFFCQPDIPVVLKYVDKFRELEGFEFITKNKKLFLTAFKLTQLKWCLIMLNEFNPKVKQRRNFACDVEIKDWAIIKSVQLEKSKLYYGKIASNIDELSLIID